MKQVAVAFVFALVAAIAVGFVQAGRDIIFEHDWARAHGKLEAGASPALMDSARDEAEKRHHGKSCVAEGLARDDRYLYVGLGCADFHSNPPVGDQDLRAARFRYSGDRAFDMERSDERAYENSVHRLFPKEVYARIWSGLAHSDYFRSGQARAGAAGI
jgi:hypothetical protein